MAHLLWRSVQGDDQASVPVAISETEAVSPSCQRCKTPEREDRLHSSTSGGKGVQVVGWSAQHVQERQSAVQITSAVIVQDVTATAH